MSPTEAYPISVCFRYASDSLGSGSITVLSA